MGLGAGLIDMRGQDCIYPTAFASSLDFELELSVCAPNFTNRNGLERRAFGKRRVESPGQFVVDTPACARYIVLSIWPCLIYVSVFIFIFYFLFSLYRH